MKRKYVVLLCFSILFANLLTCMVAASHVSSDPKTPPFDETSGDVLWNAGEANSFFKITSPNCEDEEMRLFGVNADFLIDTTLSYNIDYSDPFYTTITESYHPDENEDYFFLWEQDSNDAMYINVSARSTPVQDSYIEYQSMLPETISFNELVWDEDKKEAYYQYNCTDLKNKYIAKYIKFYMEEDHGYNFRIGDKGNLFSTYDSLGSNISIFLYPEEVLYDGSIHVGCSGNFPRNSWTKVMDGYGNIIPQDESGWYYVVVLYNDDNEYLPEQFVIIDNVNVWGKVWIEEFTLYPWMKTALIYGCLGLLGIAGIVILKKSISKKRKKH